MSKESVLTAQERAALQIEEFIFHIIRAGSEYPEYLTDVQLVGEQSQFFRDRIAEAAEGTQYVFTDPENKRVFNILCQPIGPYRLM